MASNIYTKWLGIIANATTIAELDRIRYQLAVDYSLTGDVPDSDFNNEINELHRKIKEAKERISPPPDIEPPPPPPGEPPYIPPPVPPPGPPGDLPPWSGYKPPPSPPPAPGEPPYIPPPSPPPPAGVKDPSELAGNLGAYMAAIGLSGKTYLDMMEKARESQYGRLKNLYDVISRMQVIPDESPAETTSYFNQQGIAEPGNFTNWIKGVTAGGTEAADTGTIAQALMRTLIGSNKEQRALSGTTYEPKFGEAGNPIQGTDTLGELQRLLITALKPKWGYPGAAQAASNLDLFQDQWLGRQAAAGAADPSGFIDFIINKMGLNREGLF